MTAGARPAARDAVLGSLVGFGYALRVLGVPTDVSRIETAARAVATIDPSDREAVYWALRCSLVSGHEQLEAFDATFEAFWAGSPLQVPVPEPSPPSGESTEPSEAPDPEDGGAEAPQLELGAEVDEAEPGPSAAGWSAVERLRRMDFADFGPDEIAAARSLVQRITASLPRRRSRRLRPATRGSQLDRRATLRSAMRSDGHPLELAWRDRASVSRKVVFLLDISGSMEPYARVMLMFLQAARRGSSTVEAFTFGTRLTRLTRELEGRDAERALDRAAQAVPDWAGGTRIGAALEAYDISWGRRGLTRGAVVVIVSDGWERGGLELLRSQMARLQRAAHTVVWVNPLAGSDDYQPLAAGMATALPFVDVFLPGHNLHSLGELAGVLSRLPSGRSRRALGAGPTASRGSNPQAV